MENPSHIYSVGERVRSKDIGIDTAKFSGIVIGHGWCNDAPCVLVQLDEGGYIKNDTTYTYVSAIVVHVDGIEHKE